jgi:DNA-binding NtrC family response regulator
MISDTPIVMLVTADEHRRVSMSKLLRRAGFRLQLACSEREAIHALATSGSIAQALPALLIVDQASLGLGAERVIGAVRRAELGISMIVVSSFGAADDVIGCLRAGATDYVQLPANNDEVLRIVQRALAHHMVW